MSGFRSIARTSLFARMSLLFGLLVTLPLVISGIVLSVVGWQVVTQSGDSVASIGTGTVERTTSSFNRVASTTLHDATVKVSGEAKKQILKATTTSKAIATRQVEQATSEMERSGSQAVARVTASMNKVADEELERGLQHLRDLNRQSQQRLLQTITTGMQEELDRSGDPIGADLRVSLVEAWQTSALRRATVVGDFLQKDLNQVRLSLQYPVRTVELVRAQDPDRARAVLSKYIPNAAGAIQRMILVDPGRGEVARIPQSEVDPDEVDWDDPTKPEHFTKTYLLSREAPYSQEPARLDPLSNQWIIRIAHKTIEGEERAPVSPPTSAMPAVPAGRPLPVPFVVIDYKLDGLIRNALFDSPPELQAVVVHRPTGVVVSSRDPQQINQPARAITDRLPATDDEASAFTKMPFDFEYVRQDGKKMRARAIAWEGNLKLWTVVAQPEEQILAPVQEYSAKIRSAWSGALKAVQAAGDAAVDASVTKANEETAKRQAAARKKIQVQAAEGRRQVKVSLDRARSRLKRDLSDELAKEAGRLTTEAEAVMGRASEGLSVAAAATLKEQAARATLQAKRDIHLQSNRVAQGAAQKMLLNSTWLIPLFLVLALVLATLTARSLVRPINQLVTATQAFAAGDYSQRVQVQGDDELARLSDAFNRMVEAIEQGRDELQHSNEILAVQKLRIQGIVECSPDGLIMLDREGRVGLMNPTACALLDIRPDLLPDAPFLPEELGATAGARLKEVVEAATSGDEVREWETQEPSRRVLQVREVRLRTAGLGRDYGRLVHLHDITRERVVDEMKSDFISLVSHELRTPLTSILGFSSYMLTGRLGTVEDGQKLALESIHRQARRLSAIISDFLDVSRIESGKIDMKKEPVSVSQVASRVVADLRPQAEEKRLTVEARAEEGPEPLVAIGDEQRIAQVFTNLIGNALKFTDQGGVHVDLSRSNGEIVCRVIDTGCGIPPDELEKVFDRFYQVEKVVTRKSGGTGLGLAIVKNIVEAHGGRIWIESEVGRGTTVHFTLPAMENAGMPPFPPEQRQPAGVRNA